MQIIFVLSIAPNQSVEQWDGGRYLPSCQGLTCDDIAICHIQIARFVTSKSTDLSHYLNIAEEKKQDEKWKRGYGGEGEILEEKEKKCWLSGGGKNELDCVCVSLSFSLSPSRSDTISNNLWASERQTESYQSYPEDKHLLLDHRMTPKAR